MSIDGAYRIIENDLCVFHMIQRRGESRLQLGSLLRTTV